MSLLPSDFFEFAGQCGHGGQQPTVHGYSIPLFMQCFSGTLAQWIAVGSVSLFFLCLHVIELYYYLQLWRARRQQSMIKRYAQVFIIVNVVTILLFSCERISIIMLRLDVYSVASVQWIRTFLGLIAYSFFFYFMCLRYYLLIYDIKWIQANSASNWHQYIRAPVPETRKQTEDENENENENVDEIENRSCSIYPNTQNGIAHHKASSGTNNNWWIKHRKVWGRFSIYLTCVGFGLFTLFNLIPSAIFVLFFGFGYVFVVTVFTTMVILLVISILWCRTPVFHDEFHILQEGRYSLTLLYAHCFACIGYTLLVNVVWSTKEEPFWMWFLFCFVVPFCLVNVILLLQSVWISKKDGLLKTATTNHKLRMASTLGSTLAVITTSDSRNESTSSNATETESVDLNSVLAKKIGFNAFMMHLFKEFSLENLLSVIEFTQYKQFFQEVYLSNQNLQTRASMICEPALSANNSVRMYSDLDEVREESMALMVMEENENENKNENEDKNNGNNNSNADVNKCINFNMHRKADAAVLAFNSTRGCVAFDELENIVRNSSPLIQLPPQRDFPLSSIVYGYGHGNAKQHRQRTNVDDLPRQRQTVTRDDMKEKIRKLFGKYIHAGSELELNLSSRQRKVLLEKEQMLESLNNEQLYIIFDDAIEAMMHLMQDSFGRFRMTHAFRLYERKQLNRRMHTVSRLMGLGLGVSTKNILNNTT